MRRPAAISLPAAERYRSRLRHSLPVSIALALLVCLTAVEAQPAKLPRAEAGGLMSYGAPLTENFRHAATFVDKILKGANPAELPFEQPTRYVLVVNVKTAAALGLTIPQSLLLRADGVVQ